MTKINRSVMMWCGNVKTAFRSCTFPRLTFIDTLLAWLQKWKETVPSINSTSRSQILTLTYGNPSRDLPTAFTARHLASIISSVTRDITGYRQENHAYCRNATRKPYRSFLGKKARDKKKQSSSGMKGAYVAPDYTLQQLPPSVCLPLSLS